MLDTWGPIQQGWLPAPRRHVGEGSSHWATVPLRSLKIKCGLEEDVSTLIFPMLFHTGQGLVQHPDLACQVRPFCF